MSNLCSSLLGPPEADDILTSTGGSTKPSDTGSAIVANLADLTKLGASETRLELAVDSAGCVLHVTRDTQVEACEDLHVKTCIENTVVVTMTLFAQVYVARCKAILHASSVHESEEASQYWGPTMVTDDTRQ